MNLIQIHIINIFKHSAFKNVARWDKYHKIISMCFATILLYEWWLGVEIKFMWVKNHWAFDFHILGEFLIIKKSRNEMTSLTTKIQILETFLAYQLSKKHHHHHLLTNDILWGMMYSTQIRYFKHFSAWMIYLKDIWEFSFQDQANASLTDPERCISI